MTYFMNTLGTDHIAFRKIADEDMADLYVDNQLRHTTNEFYLYNREFMDILLMEALHNGHLYNSFNQCFLYSLHKYDKRAMMLDDISCIYYKIAYCTINKPEELYWHKAAGRFDIEAKHAKIYYRMLDADKALKKIITNANCIYMIYAIDYQTRKIIYIDKRMKNKKITSDMYTEWL